MTDADRSISTDEPAAQVDDTEFDAVAAFQNRLDGDSPSDDAKEGTATKEAPEAPEGTEEDEADKPEATVAGDDAVTVIKVGDAEHRVSVKDLKRLWGQEASLTTKSQDLAEAHKRASEEGEKAVGILDAMLKRAQQKWEPYAKIDFALAATKLDEATYSQLRKDAQDAYAEVNFYKQEAGVYINTVRENRSKQNQAALKAANEALAKDEETKGWDDKAHTEVMDYAVSQGLPKEVVGTITDPAALKMIRKAMLYDRGAKVVKEKVQPVAKSAATKATLKPGARSDTAQNDKQRSSMDRLAKSGSRDDAAAAFAARFLG